MSKSASQPSSGLPFSLSPALPKLLHEHRCSLALSTYQAGKVVVISSPNGESLRHFVKQAHRPMGLTVSGGRLAIAAWSQMLVFRSSRKMALSFPDKRNYYDAMFLPRAVYFTGTADVHDIAFSQDQLWAVNTYFSCLCTVDDHYSFTPRWQPPFITELLPEDRCHLNGMATDENGPAYVTFFAPSNSREGWREAPMESGQIMRVKDNAVIVDQLPLPHSPRLIDGKLYFLLSGTGQVMVHDLDLGTTRELGKANGFLRGLAPLGDYLLVGLSSIRKSSKSFGKLPIAERARQAGIEIIHRETGENLGGILYHDGITELYDVTIIPNTIRPTILDPKARVPDRAIMGPEGLNFWRKETPKPPPKGVKPKEERYGPTDI